MTEPPVAAAAPSGIPAPSAAALPSVQVFDLSAVGPGAVEEVAAFLPRCFARWGYLPSVAAARKEVLESLGPARLSRVAIGEEGRVLGWYGGIREYDGRVWELHPMAVRPDQQRRGIGRMLLADFEARVRERGGATVVLVTDDVDGASTAHGVDLYPDIWRHMRDLAALADHPFRFYERCGYVVYGLLPDASGWGKPGILMAKRLRPSEPSRKTPRRRARRSRGSKDAVGAWPEGEGYPRVRRSR
jgi:aminoglycoside 6'-N-acetyltransferase I